MKYLDEAWKDLKAQVQGEIWVLEQYIMTPNGAREAVTWLAVMFAFCAVDGLWATWNLVNMWLSAIWGV